LSSVQTLEEKLDYVHRIKSGLSEKEARKRIKKHGLNTLVSNKGISIFKIVFDQFSDFMVMVLLASTAISIFMGEMIEAFTIIAIVIVNAIMGFVQEYKTEKTLEALKGLAAPTAKVIRDDRILTISAQEIVPGDLVLLEAGDRVPADSEVIASNSLQVDCLT
jgi:Ca2+-transporting ATPase